MGLVAVPPEEEAAGWTSVALPGRGSQEGDEWGILLPQMGMSRDGQSPHRWDNTYVLMCTATLPRGLLP